MVAFLAVENGVYNPEIELIRDPVQAAVAQEYVAAREAYQAADQLYPGHTGS